MRRIPYVLVAAAVVLALAGCSSEPAKKEETAAPAKEAPAAKKEQAPDVFKVNLDTTKGPVIIEVHRDWAPVGADHFYSLVKMGFYDGDRFFRYVRNFIVQFGINGDPKVNRVWANANLLDDPVKQTNARGTVVYATAGPNTRATQLFINLRDNAASLDRQGFAPFGKVVEGMDVVDSLYSSYGEMAAMGGQGPDPGQIETQGNEYLESKFPRLDYIKKAKIEGM
jgi:peptidyl-prolyl cis-trans isomerase A (cyclophilin A)